MQKLRKILFVFYCIFCIITLILSFFRQILEIDLLKKVPIFYKVISFLSGINLSGKILIIIIYVIIINLLYKNYSDYIDRL